MIGLSRARPQIPGSERKYSWFRKLQKISFCYRLGLKRLSLAETALEKFLLKILICLDENHFFYAARKKIWNILEFPKITKILEFSMKKSKFWNFDFFKNLIFRSFDFFHWKFQYFDDFWKFQNVSDFFFGLHQKMVFVKTN